MVIAIDSKLFPLSGGETDCSDSFSFGLELELKILVMVNWPYIMDVSCKGVKIWQVFSHYCWEKKRTTWLMYKIKEITPIYLDYLRSTPHPLSPKYFMLWNLYLPSHFWNSVYYIVVFRKGASFHKFQVYFTCCQTITVYDACWHFLVLKDANIYM